MRTTYRVRRDAADANAEAVQRVMADLAATSADVGYLVQRSGAHGEVFEHIAWGDRTALTNLPAFQDFQESLPRRLDGDVDRVEAALLGAHHRVPPEVPGPERP